MKWPLIASLLTTLLFVACTESTEPSPLTRDQVFQTQLYDVRLGDGVPLDISLSVRWKIEATDEFFQQFSSIGAYDSLILRPRSREIAAGVGNTYPSIDSLFTTQRFAFINDLKHAFSTKLLEEGMEVKEVIVSEIEYPVAFTQAKERVGLKEQEMESIRQQAQIDQERALAARQKAEADGKVAVAEAQVQGRLEKIQAETEKSRRKIEMARAETERQVAEMKAKTEAKRIQLLAQADLEKNRQLKKLEIEHQRDLQTVEVEKERSTYQLSLEQELEQAKLCAENPSYASFLISRELASKVQIAVVPSDGSGNLFGDLLGRGLMPTPQTTANP